jgi:hypothetical protein
VWPASGQDLPFLQSAVNKDWQSFHIG